MIYICREIVPVIAILALAGTVALLSIRSKPFANSALIQWPCTEAAGIPTSAPERTVKRHYRGGGSVSPGRMLIIFASFR